MIFVMLVWLLANALAQDFLTELFHLFNPRTAGGLSHLRTAGGGADDRPPPENSKTKKDSDKR